MIHCVTSRGAVIMMVIAVVSTMLTYGAEMGVSTVTTTTFPTAVISQLTIPTCVGDLMVTTSSNTTASSTSTATNVTITVHEDLYASGGHQCCSHPPTRGIC